MKHLILVSLLAGCGPSTVCKHPDTGPIEVEFESSCGAIGRNIDLARELMLPNIFVGLDAAGFREKMKKIEIRIRESERVKDPNGVLTYGIFWEYQSGRKEIEMGRDMRSLAHEFLHAVEGPDQGHMGWQSRGWFEISNNYSDRREKIE